MKSSQPIDGNSQLVEVPPTIKTHYGNVQLAADVAHVNEVPFLTSLSNHMHYGSANAVHNMKADALEDGLKNLVRCYAIRCFTVVVILVDMQFKSLKDRKK